MGSKKLKSKDLRKAGIPEGKLAEQARQAMDNFFGNKSKSFKRHILKELFQTPENYVDNEFLGKIASNILNTNFQNKEQISLNQEKAPFKIFGEKEIEPGAIEQMNLAVQLPVAGKGALMPDAHQGYGLPIGGVLALKNAVMPYGVGLDIGCRMALSVFPLTHEWFKYKNKGLQTILLNETRFGQATFDKKMDDPVFDNIGFKEINIARQLKDKAYKQLGSSGGGNHFVEFGITQIPQKNPWNIEGGKYLGVLSHSGSRGFGAGIADYYTKIALDKCRLPKPARHLAWLYLDNHEGAEYWEAMQLAGAYASACHRVIHHRIGCELGEHPILKIEHHHNFAWREKDVDGQEWIIHRKGATPAHVEDTGIIPGSMTSPAYIVSGKGKYSSLNSAAHGAGRKMSRRKAKLQISEDDFRKHLKENNVTLFGSDLDETPQAYKNIDKVMGHQEDLVQVLGSFEPKIIRMAGNIDRFTK